MSLQILKKDITNLMNALNTIEQTNIGLELKKGANVLNFKESRTQHLKLEVNKYIKSISSNANIISSELKSDKLASFINLINLLNSAYTNSNISDMKKHIDSIASIISELDQSPNKPGFSPPKKLPLDIHDEIVADIHELDRCFSSGCYRSCVILCGRILEIALHRKYFEATGNDILEKSPGIGLGKIIAKLKEKEVVIDPGLTQQIHLINQVRVMSVHKKQEAFYPSMNQAKAVMLYTQDVLDKFYS